MEETKIAGAEGKNAYKIWTFSLVKCAAGELVVGREEEPIMIIFRYLSHGNLNESEGARMGSARELLR